MSDEMHEVTSKNTVDETDFKEACLFLIEVGKAANRYGSSAAQVESYVARLAERLGYHAVFRSNPNELIFAFKEKEGEWQHLYLEETPDSGYNSNRLAKLGELVASVVAGQTSIKQANRQIKEIDQLPNPWNNLAVGFSYVIAGAGFAILLQGGIWDVILSALLSLVVFGIVMLVGRYGGVRVAASLPLTTALAAGALAASAKFLLPEVNAVLVTVCAILILLPGFTITQGIIDMVGSRVVSGMANLMNGLVYMGKQVIGAWVGVSLVTLSGTVPQAAPGLPLPPVLPWLIIMPLILGMCFVFQTPRKDFLIALLIAAITYVIVVFGGYVNANVSLLIAAALAAVLANLWSARTERSTTTVMLPAFLLLVAGSIGFRGLAAIAAGQTAIGWQEFLHMFVVALVVAAGFIVGNTIVPRRAAL